MNGGEVFIFVIQGIVIALAGYEFDRILKLRKELAAYSLLLASKNLQIQDLEQRLSKYEVDDPYSSGA